MRVGRFSHTNWGSIGIVLIPGMYGTSLSFRWHKWMLRLRGFHVAVVDTYPFGRPLCLRYIWRGGNEALRHWLFDYISDAYITSRTASIQGKLRSRGCTKIVVMGFGYGATAALRSRDVDGVVAWYPSLSFHEGSSKEPPDLTQLTYPAFFVVGARDQETAASRKVFDAAVATGKDLGILMIPDTGFGFADWTRQYFIPNTSYRLKAAWQGWGEVYFWMSALLRG